MVPTVTSLYRNTVVEDSILETHSKDCREPLDKNSNSVGKKRKRQKNFCIYCETAVTNFSRHIIRNHKLEIDVQQILSKPKLSNDRKQLLTLLRNIGNFLENVNRCTKPMKMLSGPIDSDKYLPSSSCLGFYSRKQLLRHRKKCVQVESSRSKSHQVDGQTLLLRNYQYNQQLKEKVFPRMRADTISITGSQNRQTHMCLWCPVLKNPQKKSIRCV